jgi:outer membrane protein OmpA-like peptidoglycan-associated protein
LHVTVWTIASVLLLCGTAVVPVAAAPNASGRSSSVDVDLGVLDSVPPPPPAAPETKPAPTLKAPSMRRGVTPPDAGRTSLPKPAAVPPPRKLPPPSAPAATSAGKPEPPAAPTTAPTTTAPTVAVPLPVTGSPSAAPPPAVAATPPAATAALSPPPPTVAAAATAAGRIAFASGDSALSDDAKAQLAPLVGQLSANDRLHVDVLGYAAGGNDQSQARRLSLARALAVRSYLVDRGIPTTRVDVRALGSRNDTAANGAGTGAGPADRVDIVLAERPTP